MLLKLAFRNVRRSARDYSIYFVTLLFSVALFYAFNSISSQKALFDMEQGLAEVYFESFTIMMGLVSFVIAFVLAFLIIYANRFLIKRRKREFGTYLLLGMTPAQVSTIVVIETACVGVVSLALGLLLGTLVSQGLSFVTAALFAVKLDAYHFIFSPLAFFVTVVCFAALFAVTALFNVVQVRRCKLITLLNAQNASEHYKVRNPWISLAGFIVAIVLLVLAYQALYRNGLMDLSDNDFKLATVLMLVGTLVLFWSLAGFVLAVVKRLRGVYFKGLAMFTMRQIASKVNTAFLSLWAVAVLLFFALTIFSGGIGIANVFSGDVEENTLYDATFTAGFGYYSDSGDEETVAQYAELHRQLESCDGDTAAYLSEHSPSFDKLASGAAQVDVWYTPGVTYQDIADALGCKLDSVFADAGAGASEVQMVSVSQFNDARELAGREPIELSDDEFAVDNTVSGVENLARAYERSGLDLTIGGVKLHSDGTLLKQALCVTDTAQEMFTLVVPDRVVDALRASGELPISSSLNIMFRNGIDQDEADDLIMKITDEVRVPVPEEGAFSYTEIWPIMQYYTADEMRVNMIGFATIITYLAIYMGFVLLIATAAVLAIQQLSETADSLGRYRIIAELGCDRKMIFSSLRKQTVIYFLAPLVVALCHSACAIYVMSDVMFAYFGMASMLPVVMALVLLVVIYGVYLLVTYYGSKGAIRVSLGKKLVG